MSKEKLKEKYGKNKKNRALFNAAIREECPGGNELLDLLELVSAMRGRVSTRDEAKKLEVIEDRLQVIRDRMYWFIREAWNID